MTSNPSLLNSLIPSPVKSVQVANGTPMPISGFENVSFSSTLLLSSVLLAPNLSNNLLSISKITKNLNCYVTFHSTHCVFQDNLTKTRLDISYAVSVVSQFMHNPSNQHMSTINSILAYLKSSLGKGILFSKHGHLDIEGYTL